MNQIKSNLPVARNTIHGIDLHLNVNNNYEDDAPTTVAKSYDLLDEEE